MPSSQEPRKLSRVIVIDPKCRTLFYRAIDVKDPNALRDLVGGYIEIAFTWPSGDVLYVNEEGLLRPAMHFFRLADRPGGLPLVGPGVVVGRELFDEENEWIGNAGVALTVPQLRPRLRWMNRAQADAYARANASDTAASLTEVHSDGRREVISRTSVREFWKDVPREDPE